MNIKSIFTSRTFWFNVLSLAAAYQGLIPKEYAIYAIPLINILLRKFTTEPVKIL